MLIITLKLHMYRPLGKLNTRKWHRFGSCSYDTYVIQQGSWYKSLNSASKQMKLVEQMWISLCTLPFVYKDNHFDLDLIIFFTQARNNFGNKNAFRLLICCPIVQVALLFSTPFFISLSIFRSQNSIKYTHISVVQFVISKK